MTPIPPRIYPYRSIFFKIIGKEVNYARQSNQGWAAGSTTQDPPALPLRGFQALGERKYNTKMALKMSILYGCITEFYPHVLQNLTLVSFLNGPLDRHKAALLGAMYLATCDSYHLTRKNDSYQLVIWNGHLWGGI
jgi:hypothetical protein